MSKVSGSTTKPVQKAPFSIGTSTSKQVKKKPITTVDKRFYSGMTRAEAEKKGIYKKFMGTDFKDIDKNGDGILSNKEILAQRDKDTRNLKATGVLNAIGGTIAAVSGTLTSGVGVGFAITGGGIALWGVGMNNIEKANKEAEETAKLRKQLNIKG